MIDINIPDPKFESSLNTLILDLERLRNMSLSGTTPIYIFYQIRSILRLCETLGSARIEGNKTTLSKMIDNEVEKNTNNEVEKNPNKDESSIELQNLNNATKFIEKNTKKEAKIDRAYISEIHKIVTQNLQSPPRGEGSKDPGNLRTKNVKIQGSAHVPPDSSCLLDYYEKFLSFINAKNSKQYDLLILAIAHHRFSYIHPFDNGNGRVGRLLNYALIIKLFNVQSRVINPSAVFYENRDEYYKNLSIADSLKDKDVLIWVEYFLSGLKTSITKLDQLSNLTFCQNDILLPALKNALDKNILGKNEHKVLAYLVNQPNMIIKASQLGQIGFDTSKKKSAIISKLKTQGFLKPNLENGRKYQMVFKNNALLRAIISVLLKKQILSPVLEQETL